MKFATQCALAGGLLLAGIAHACATPVEIEGCQPNTPGAQSCDVILSQASDFGGPDASVPVATAGSPGAGGAPPSGNAGSGSNPPPGGSAGNGANPPPGGSGGLSGMAGSSSGLGGAAGSGSAGAGGSGTAGSGSAGAGGAAGSGSGSAGTGSGGTGSTSNFDLDSCDLQNRVGCEEFACETACPAGGEGNYCRTNCPLIVNCVAAAPSCITEADPMCGIAAQNPYTPNECTDEVNSSGSPTQNGTPANVALELITCLCSDPRP